jgi:hypothetical protein
MNTQFINEFNTLLSPLYTNHVWAYIEFFSAISIFIFSIWQRAYLATSLTENRSDSFGVVINQLSLYLHIVISMLMIADVLENYDVPYDISSARLLLACFACAVALRKIGVFITFQKIPSSFIQND